MQVAYPPHKANGNSIRFFVYVMVVRGENYVAEERMTDFYVLRAFLVLFERQKVHRERLEENTSLLYKG